MPDDFDALVARGGTVALEMAGRFFMGDNPVIYALRKVTRRLDEHRIPYAVAGGLAVAAHGYQRTTVDVDLLVTSEGLVAAHERLEGLGYVPPFSGSKQLKDTENGVRVEFLVTGQYPGDGKPKPVAFPDPADVATDIDGVRFVSLPALIQLKLASAMTGGVARLKDYADVVALIQQRGLTSEFAAQLDAYVRPKYLELVEGLRTSPPPP